MQDLEMSINNPGGTVTCDAFTTDRRGEQLKVVRRVTSNIGEVVLDWGSSLNLSTSKGTYAIFCSIPNGATIHSIFYVEP
jgi:hypothetical protein